MKKIIIKILCLGTMLVLNANSFAQLHYGMSLDVTMMPTEKSTSSFLGVTFDFGFNVTKNSYLLFNVGYDNGFTYEEIGTFSYFTMDKYGNFAILDNGVIKRHGSIIPIHANWDWRIDLSDDFSLHLGPSVGLSLLNGYNKYYVGNKEWEPYTILGEEHKPRNNKYKPLYGVGANAALMYRDFGLRYKFLWHGSKTFEEVSYKGSMHQIALFFLIFGD